MTTQSDKEAVAMPALVKHPTAQGASLEEREIGSNQGRLRRMVRYSGQSRWYRSAATAAIAWQAGDDRPAVQSDREGNAMAPRTDAEIGRCEHGALYAYCTANHEREGNAMGAVKGYADGFEYGRRVGARMAPERRRDIDRFVAGSEYVRRGSVTRAYWLGFRRAMRGGS